MWLEEIQASWGGGRRDEKAQREATDKYPVSSEGSEGHPGTVPDQAEYPAPGQVVPLSRQPRIHEGQDRDIHLLPAPMPPASGLPWFDNKLHGPPS